MKILLLTLLLTGCATVEQPDPAHYIVRNCPVKYVAGEEAARAVLTLAKWSGGDVFVIGECVHDAKAIVKWIRANGMEAHIDSVDSGRHWTVHPENSRYYIDYITGIGLVHRRIGK